MSDKKLWLERVGKDSFIGHSSEGPTVAIGHGEGQFTPGDLMKLALAGCHGASADARLMAALGEDYGATIGIDSEYDKETDRFTHMDVEMVMDLSGLEDADREKLEERTRAAIDRYCTISHTLKQGITVKLVISSEF